MALLAAIAGHESNAIDLEINRLYENRIFTALRLPTPHIEMTTWWSRLVRRKFLMLLKWIRNAIVSLKLDVFILQ